jgi:hypothetical protein
MNPIDRRLRRDIIAALVIKLALLATLWWLFVREAQVAVEPATVATHIASPAATTQRTQSKGESDGQ